MTTHYCLGNVCTICYPMYCVHSSSTQKTPHRCPICNGRGLVANNFYNNFGSSTDASDIECRSCVRGIIYT